MYLPEMPAYERPPIRWGLIITALVANFALALALTMVMR